VPLSDFKLSAIERNSTNPHGALQSLDRRVEWNSIKSDGSCGSPDQIALTQARVDDKVDAWLDLAKESPLDQDLLLDLNELTVRPMDRVMNNVRQKNLAVIDPEACAIGEMDNELAAARFANRDMVEAAETCEGTGNHQSHHHRPYARGPHRDSRSGEGDGGSRRQLSFYRSAGLEHLFRGSCPYRSGGESPRLA
jgi:hypothetical protein